LKLLFLNSILITLYFLICFAICPSLQLHS